MTLTTLIPEQVDDLKQHGHYSRGFNVRGSDERIYRILYYDDCNNILAVFNWFNRDYYYLLGRNPRNWMTNPLAESRFMAQKVHLECDARPFRNEDYACRIRVPVGSEVVRRMLDVGDYGGKI